MKKKQAGKRSRPAVAASARKTRSRVAPYRKAVEALTAIDEEYRRRRSKLQAFVRANKHLPCVERAEAWLRFVAADPEGYGDQEALVYLTERGEDCSPMIQKLNEDWRADEERAIEDCARGHGVSYLGRKVSYLGGMSLSAAREIEHVSPYDLRDFWYGHRQQEQTITATMLRTVESCALNGFEKWWKRLARETTTTFIEGGLDHGPLKFWLFAMCRSELAISLMPKALHLALDNIELVRRGTHPWMDTVPISAVRGKPHEYKYGDIDNFDHAATLVFANYRLRDGSARNKDLLDEATGLLQKHQRPEGSWPFWSGREKSSIQTTATAIYALVYHKPNGWQRHVQAAVKWLESQQDEGGYWVEPSSPDPTYLTVLVLDALELARAGEAVTFGRGPAHTSGGSNESPLRFSVALSFPGESRVIVERVAELLVEKLGRERVFYDKNFEAELARPDLDLYLQDVYLRRSELVVVWLSADYQKKEWCGNVEWPAIRDILKRRRGHGDVMFLKLDDKEVEGHLSIDGYVDVRSRPAAEITKLILQRLDHNRRQDGVAQTARRPRPLRFR
jgi:hypothetical protein